MIEQRWAMDSTELYRQLLGVTAPWTVQRVAMDVHGLSVDGKRLAAAS
jgi:hypothetical protein